MNFEKYAALNPPPLNVAAANNNVFCDLLYLAIIILELISWIEFIRVPSFSSLYFSLKKPNA